MPYFRKSPPLIVLCCLLAALLSGCASGNGVKLTYALGQNPTPCSGEMILLKFADKRPSDFLGKTKNGAALTPLSDVADWVGWALFDELSAAGATPKYRTTTVTPGDGLLVSGEVLEASLNQTGTTTYAAKVVVKIIIMKSGQTTHVEKFTSEVEDVVVPGYGTRSDVMAEALRGLIVEVIPSICSRM